MRLKLLLLFPAVLSLALAQNLLTNGDFEQDLSVGWTIANEGSGTQTCDRSVTYHPDPDYEAMAYQYDNPGAAQITQTVDVPGVQLHVSFWAKFEQSGETSCWPAACFRVCYYDATSTLLGETRYYHAALEAWSPSATFHPIRISTPDWTEYEFDVVTELANNLPGVNPAQVARVGVALYAYTYSG